jgi:hypothetical protein
MLKIKRPYTAVASKLGIGPSSASNYLQRYIALVEATASDPDFPRRARLVLNKNVPEKYHIPDEDIINLRPLTEVYGRHKNLNAQAYNQTNPAYSYDQNMSYGNPNDPFQRNPMGQPNLEWDLIIYRQAISRKIKSMLIFQHFREVR